MWSLLGISSLHHSLNSWHLNFLTLMHQHAEILYQVLLAKFRPKNLCHPLQHRPAVSFPYSLLKPHPNIGSIYQHGAYKCSKLYSKLDFRSFLSCYTSMGLSSTTSVVTELCYCRNLQFELKISLALTQPARLLSALNPLLRLDIMLSTTTNTLIYRR